MKFVISRLDLLSLINKLQAVVPQKPTSPILGTVLVEALNDRIVMSATDLTVSVRSFTEGKVFEEGGIALPARRFFQLIKELTTPVVEIETTSAETAFIRAGTSHFKMGGMMQSEFPELPAFSLDHRVRIKNGSLREVLTRSAFAAAKDDNRQVLNGVLLQSQNSQAAFIGSDGKRLARISAEIETPSEAATSQVIPLKAVDEMIKLLDDKESESSLFFMKDRIALETGSVTLISKLLNGQYPDVERVIPKKEEAPITLHREELISLLRQVSLFTPDASSSVQFSFTPGELHLSAIHGEFGEGKVCMAVNYGGPKLDIAFNPNYFLDILRHSKDETIQLSVKGPFHPGLVTDSTRAEFVIMPMRLLTATA